MDVLKTLDAFYKNYDGEKGFIGRTERGIPIPFFAVEKTPFPKIIIQCAVHAREYITTYLALFLTERFKKYGEKGKIYFIPAVNIDGIKIALTKDPLYKANANGVDLNVNFDARWGEGEKNVRKSGGENYIGKRPFSESETRALRDFTLKISPDATVSYHSKGEEIYYFFGQEKEIAERDLFIAQKLAASTGYDIKLTPLSAGGYKDWCIEKLKIPSFTIEAGRDELSHPIKKENLPEIAEKNKDVPLIITESL